MDREGFCAGSFGLGVVDEEGLWDVRGYVHGVLEWELWVRRGCGSWGVMYC